MASHPFGVPDAHSTLASPRFGHGSSNCESFHKTPPTVNANPSGNPNPFGPQVAFPESKITASPFGSTFTYPTYRGFGSSNCGSSIQTPVNPCGPRASFLESKSTGSPFGSTITCESNRGCTQPSTLSFSNSMAHLQGCSSVGANIGPLNRHKNSGFGQPSFGPPSFSSRVSTMPPLGAFPPSSPSCLRRGPPSTIGLNTTPSSDVGGFGRIFGDKIQGGSMIAPYCETQDDTGGKLMSLSAMKSFHDKSHEELRWEDYKNFKNIGFGAPQPLIQPSGHNRSIFSNDKNGNFSPISGSLDTGATTFGPPSFSFGLSAQPSFGPPFSSGVSTTPVIKDSKTPTIGVFPPTPSDFEWKPASSIGLTTTSLDFAVIGCGQTGCEKSQQGGTSIAPYSETQDIDSKLMSVSLTENFRHKSHEEIRWEDYNNYKNKGISSSIPKTDSHGLSDCNSKCHQSNATPSTQATKNNEATNDSTNTFVNYNNQPFAAFSIPAYITFVHPIPPAFPSQHFGSPFGSQISGALITHPYGIILNGLNGYHSLLVPMESPVMGLNGGSINVSGPNGGNCSNGASSVFGSVGGPSMGCLGLNGSHLPRSVPVESPVMGLHGAPIHVSGPNGGNCSNGASSVSGSVGDPNTDFVGLGSNTTPLTEKIDAKVQASVKNPISECPRPVSENDVKKSGHIPKGLEIIVEKSGFNPWLSQGEVTNSSKVDSKDRGEILCCEEADKDEDIIALAEFAVEQHNALHKDDQVVLTKVIVACLEALEGGRYHLVVEVVVADSPNNITTKMHYAVVLRKATHRSNNLTVLEKWLPC